MSVRERPVHTTPLDSRVPSKSKPSKSAAGMPAIISTLKHGMTKMGVRGTISNLTKVNKFSGFDCPGCAWPDPDYRRTIAEFCENGAKAIADEATLRRADPDFWSQNTVVELSKRSDQWLNSQGRLTHPLIIKEGSEYYEEIEWGEAFDFIANELANLDSPDQALFYTSGRTSNEAAYLWQLLARRIGTNNLPDCSNMCHESSGVALNQSIGIGKGTVKLDDFEKADLILVIGQNPGTNHPRMLTALRDSKRAGASIVSINPLKETGMVRFKHPQNPLEVLGTGNSIADRHIRVKVNGDQALFRGLAKIIIPLLEEQPQFIIDHTHGFDQYRDSVANTSWSEIVSQSGVERSEINKLGKLMNRADSIICCWAMGLTQHKNSVATIQEIVNVLLLGGNIGRPGAGLCPVRGHSNVQGDRTVGINHDPSEEFLESLETEFGIKPVYRKGSDSVDAVKRMTNGESNVFLSMGGNFLSAMSDTNATAKALQNCKLTVQISTKPNRSHLITGKTGIILPCLGRTESDMTGGHSQLVTVENSMGVVHTSIGVAQPASKHLMSEPAIVSGIAGSLESLIGSSGIKWGNLAENYDRIRDCIERTIPGFDRYNERCRWDGGFYLPNPPRDDLVFNTSTGRANFISNELNGINQVDGEFLMMTIRSHDQYNTTIYGTDDRYRGISGGRRVVMMNHKDMKSNGWVQYQEVSIKSNYNGIERSSEGWYLIEYDIPPGNVATYFPESNVLIPLDSVADLSKTPTSKSVIVSISA